MALPNSTNTATPWFAVSMGLLGVIAGFGIATAMGGSMLPGKPPIVAQQPSPTPTPSAPTPAAAPVDVRPYDADVDYLRGSADAKITVIEYSDFECPFCARHHPTIQQVLAKYPDDVNFVYRHFPLSFHPNAQKAAEAAECAGKLAGDEGFYKMHDLLFEKGSDNTQLEAYATQSGLNASAFKTCLDSGEFAQKVADQMAEGSAAGVRGTPGNIIYNNDTEEAQSISGAQPVSAFDAIISQMLAS